MYIYIFLIKKNLFINWYIIVKLNKLLITIEIILNHGVYILKYNDNFFLNFKFEH